jgi:hypothetical protein
MRIGYEPDGVTFPPPKIIVGVTVGVRVEVTGIIARLFP